MTNSRDLYYAEENLRQAYKVVETVCDSLERQGAANALLRANILREAIYDADFLAKQLEVELAKLESKG